MSCPRTRIFFLVSWRDLLNHPRCRGSLSHLITLNDTHTRSVNLVWTRPPSVAEASNSTLTRDIHIPSGIRTRNHNKRATADQRLEPCGHWDRRWRTYSTANILDGFENLPEHEITFWLYIFYCATIHIVTGTLHFWLC